MYVMYFNMYLKHNIQRGQSLSESDCSTLIAPPQERCPSYLLCIAYVIGFKDIIHSHMPQLRSSDQIFKKMFVLFLSSSTLLAFMFSLILFIKLKKGKLGHLRDVGHFDRKIKQSFRKHRTGKCVLSLNHQCV